MMIRTFALGAITLSCALGTTAASIAAPQDDAIVTTESDPRSERIGAFLDEYLVGDFSNADKIFKPDTDFYWADMSEAMSLDRWREGVALQHEAFRDFKMMNRVIVTTEYPEYGPWTYVWTNWQATSKATGEPLNLPLHLMYRWDGDRVSDEFAYFDKGRFESVLEDTMARLEVADAPNPWKWVLGTWKVTGDPAPEAVVSWTKLDGAEDIVRGEWVDANGVRSIQMVDWDPSTGSITSTTFGSDGSTFRMVMTDFPAPTKMIGTFRARDAKGVVSGGPVELEKESDDRMVGRFTDAGGMTMERIFTAAPMDDSLRKAIAPMVSGNDWRTKAVDEMHGHYMKGDIEAMKPIFSKDCVHKWGDPNSEAGQAEWAEGLAMHHKVFKDISLENLYSMSGAYPDGNTWTASWFEWNGTDRKTGEKATFLVHCAFRWDGDEIVEEEVFFDVDRFRKHVEASGLN